MMVMLCLEDFVSGISTPKAVVPFLTDNKTREIFQVLLVEWFLRVGRFSRVESEV